MTKKPSNKTKKSKLPRIEENRWCQLPDLVLEKVFSYLDIEEKFCASLVCTSWNRGFSLPNSWSTFVFQDTTLTKSRFTYSGWQYIIDRKRTQQCLTSIGCHIQELIFTPMNNFYNVYEFMNAVSNYIDSQGQVHIQTLKYTFPCSTTEVREDQQNQSNRKVYGAGGKLLEALKRLLGNLKNLKHVELKDLMLDGKEAVRLLDPIDFNRRKKLRKLKLLNVTETSCQILCVGSFLNLQVLEMSPQNLGEELVNLLGDLGLQHLHIVQNQLTPVNVTAVRAKAWRQCVAKNPCLKVHLRLESKRERPLLWQERAPVHTVLYASPHSKLDTDVIKRTTDYHENLFVFGHLELPRFFQPKSFNERMDSSLVEMCRVCTKLHTLVIRERISTCTLLLLASEVKSLRNLYVRRNAVILRCDWPHNPDWSSEFHKWLCTSSRSYEITEQEVAKKLGHSWRLLSDEQFKKLTAYQLSTKLT